MTSDPERADVSWRKAEAHLSEAAAQDADLSPMAVIHSSYYAMFHAARAVLFKAAGIAPKRHDGVIQQFGLLVRDLDDALRTAGRASNAIKDDRTAADYDETILPSPEETREALRSAVDFLAIWTPALASAAPRTRPLCCRHLSRPPFGSNRPRSWHPSAPTVTLRRRTSCDDATGIGRDKGEFARRGPPSGCVPQPRSVRLTPE